MEPAEVEVVEEGVKGSTQPQRAEDDDSRREIPLGGRMSAFTARYAEEFPRESLVVRVAKEGLFIKARPIPKHLRVPRLASLDGVKQALVTGEVQEMLKQGVVERVDRGNPRNPFQAYSAMIVVPKPHSTALRPCLDLSWVNKSIPNESFKMEGIRTAKDLIRRGDWMGKIDIKTAYWQVPIAEKCRDLFRFCVGNQHYRHVGLPMGVNVAPRLFTRIMKTVLAPLRRQGIRMVIYLDDILIISETEKDAKAQIALVAMALVRVG